MLSKELISTILIIAVLVAVVFGVIYVLDVTGIKDFNPPEEEEEEAAAASINFAAPTLALSTLNVRVLQ